MAKPLKVIHCWPVVGIAATIVGVVAAMPATEKVTFQFDPYNNPSAQAEVHMWPDWYYHKAFGYDDVDPNTLAVPTYVLRMRHRKHNADGTPLTYADMSAEVTASSGRFSSDDTELAYEIRITQTSWDEGVTSSPIFSLAGETTTDIKMVDDGVVGGLSADQVSRIIRSAPAAAFGPWGDELRLCKALVVASESDSLRVECRQ